MAGQRFLDNYNPVMRSFLCFCAKNVDLEFYFPNSHNRVDEKSENSNVSDNEDMLLRVISSFVEQINSLMDKNSDLEQRILACSNKNVKPGCNHTVKNSNNKANGYCYYHRKFKYIARRCRQPCAWKN